MPKVIKVLVAVPAVDRQIQVCTAKTLLVMGADKRATCSFMFAQSVPIDECRNNIIDRFLNSDADWLISIDDDVGCEKNPIDMCFIGKDIVFLPTPIIQEGNIKFNVHYLTKGDGLCEVSKGGTGCFVLSKRAAETIPKPLFRFQFDKEGRLELGEDYYFSAQALKHFKLYTHNGYKCSHVKGLDLLSFDKTC